MQRDTALSLDQFAEAVARAYSARPGSVSFEVQSIKATSATTALVLFRRGCGKLCLGLFYEVAGRWWYFLPRADHVPGLSAVAEAMVEVEQYNFKVNTRGS